MKIITSLAILAAVAGCEQTSSRLDKVTGKDKVSDHAAAAPATPAGSGGAKIDRSGSVEDRLARLEDDHDRNAGAMEFLNQVYAQQKQQREAQEREEPAPDAMFAVNVNDDIKAGQVDGPATAAVTIVKAFDFACPYCQQAAGTMTELVKDYGGKVRVVYANMLVHAPAKPAHLASCAAAKQGKYKEFKDAFWEKGFGPYAASQGKDQAPLGEANILTIAQGLGLDTAKLKAVEDSGVPAGDYYDKVVLAKGEKQFRSKMDPKPN